MSDKFKKETTKTTNEKVDKNQLSGRARKPLFRKIYIFFLMYKELKAWKHMLVLTQKALRTKIFNSMPIWKEKEAILIYV